MALARWAIAINKTSRSQVPAEAQTVDSGYRSMCEGWPIARRFWVASWHEMGVEHTVYLHRSGRLSCECLASRYRVACAHRIAVPYALEEEARQTRVAEASDEDALAVMVSPRMTWPISSAVVRNRPRSPRPRQVKPRRAGDRISRSVG